MLRELVTIDESRCDGCGLCVTACHEGALRIVDRKARLVSDVLCDGLGACLGECPRGAIKIERRDAAAFDEAAVAARLAVDQAGRPSQPLPLMTAPLATIPSGPAHAGGGGCPGSRFAQFGPPARHAALNSENPARDSDAVQADRAASSPSALTHWPVQLRLLPPAAPVLRGACLLIAADCVPVAYPDFHQKLLRGRAVVVGCPKFDDLASYVERLTEMIRMNALAEVVVARMEVPCCGGLLAAARTARQNSGVNVRLSEVVVGVRGEIVSEREIPA